MLKIYNKDRDYIIKWDLDFLDKYLYYEERSITIIDRDVHNLRKMESWLVKA